MRPFPIEQAPNKTRIIAKVLRDLVAHESFDSIADLKDVLWRRLHRLRLAVTPAEVDDALSLVGSNAALVAAPPSSPPLAPDRLVTDAPPIDRDTAARVLARLRVPAPRMPAVTRITPAQADRAAALQMVLQELQATMTRCDALDAAVVRDRDGEEG